ncbi:MAG: DUF362 domain-containing protein [Deltaproteobacteria bacterium]|nr:DUF362 domain-containing protein [Deltaproteobacteria bacterium]
MEARFGRRELFRRGAIASAALAIGGRTARAEGGDRVALVKLQGVKDDLDAAVKKLLSPLGGMQSFVRKGDKVLLKPNMGFATPPERRATTSPGLVAAVARLALGCGAARVLIADHPMRKPEACLRLNGIQAAVSGLDNVHVLLPMAATLFVSREIPQGKSLRRVQIFKDALEVDVHIALPVAKSHMAAGFSGGVKGMMGLILDRESLHSRCDLNQAIADLGTVLKAQLSILDGLSIMATDGPAGPGELIERNTLVAGTDSVAVDALGVELAPLYRRRIKARQIKHLKAAAAMGVGKLALPAAKVRTLSM